MIWIETDLEPDDILALRILKKFDYCVVGEGQAQIKYNRMIQYCDLLSLKPIIIKGFDSDKPFPNDGKEFANLPEIAGSTKYLEEFIKFAKTENPIMFSIKPLRELIHEYEKNPDLITDLVKNIELYAYGGFNFRCLLNSHEKSLLQLLKAFKKVNVYESFYVSGTQNSVNKDNFPKLYKKIIDKSSDKFFSVLLKLTEIWNSHIRDEISQNIKTLKGEALKRSQKIIDSINGNENFQYVLADFGLTTVYQKILPKPIKNFRFENSYSKFDFCESGEISNLYFYDKIANEVIENLICERF